MSIMTTTPPIPPYRYRYRLEGRGIPSPLEWLEETAFDLASEAGRLITASLERDIGVSYKDIAQGLMAPRDPVSTVDLEVEQLLRRRIAVRHPGHGFLGEGTGLSGPDDSEHLWVVDPVDGTMNLVNGVPLFASTVAVLRRGVPVAGATWAATTHALRPGIYHAHAGGVLGFDGDDLEPARNAWGVQRRVSTAPMPTQRHAPRWDYRSLGSAASESAYVAAGMLASARFESHRSWDVAAGIVLAQAAGHEVWTSSGGRWQPFAGFGDDAEGWCQSVLLATPEAFITLRPGL